MKTIIFQAMNLNKLKLKAVTLLVLLFAGITAIAQYGVVTTVPPLTGGNGYGGVSFNVTASQSVEIDSLYFALNTTSTTLDIWYNTTAVSGPPTISTGSGWVLLGTVTTNGANTGTAISNPVQALPIELNLLMQAGQTFGFYVGSTSGGNIIYQTYSSAPTTFTDGVITINNGPNVGYGGNYPNPTFSTRQFCGAVGYSIPSTAPNDAGISSIISPSIYCQGDSADLIVKLNNFGTEQLDSCQITWNVNGTLTTDWFVVNLDTFGGSGPTDTILTLDNLVLSGATNIEVYTSLPNNLTDTVNLNDSAFYDGSPSLNGTYTLGSSASANFSSFTNFVDSLNMVGVCGPVVVEIEDGTYSESIVLDEVPSMSAVNTVTFRGANMNAALDTLTTNSANPTITMAGGDYFSFEYITIENTNGNNYAVSFTGGSDYNTFDNCHFRNNESTITLADALVYSGTAIDQYNTFSNNLFENGSYGVYWYGTSTVALEAGNIFRDNEFLNQYFYGGRIYYQSNLLFEGNSIHSNAIYTNGYGIFAYYCDDSKFIGNHIYAAGDQPWPLYGMYLGLNDASSFSNPGVVANNVISIGDTNNTSSSYTGIYLTSNNVADVVYNTSIIRGGGVNGEAIFQSTCDYGRFANNVMANYGLGYAYYETLSITVINDNNVYHSDTLDIIYNGQAYTSLTEWQNASGVEDQSSIEIDPNFTDIITGVFCNDTIDNIGIPIATTSDDFNGISRSTVTPDPGAYEFFGLSGLDLGPDTTYCGGEFVLSVGDSNLVNSVSWVVNNVTYNTPTYVVQSTNGAQSFNISANVATSCGTASDNVALTLVAPAQLDDSIHICANDMVTLDANGGPTASLTWFPAGQTTNTIDVSAPGFFSVTKVESGCESSASTVVTQSAQVEILDQEPCEADLPLVVSASIPDATAFAWSGGTTPSAASNSFDASGDYAVTVTDAFACQSTDSFSIEVLGPVTAKITQTHAGTYYQFSSATSTNVGSNASYLWVISDGAIYTTPNPSHTFAWGNPSSPPTHSVELTITTNCGLDSESKSYVIDVLGTNTIEDAKGYTVFPNPTSANWNVSFTTVTSSVSVEVIDVTGRIVQVINNQNTSNVLVNTEGLSAGNYILKVTADDAVNYSNVVLNK